MKPGEVSMLRVMSAGKKGKVTTLYLIEMFQIGSRVDEVTRQLMDGNLCSVFWV